MEKLAIEGGKPVREKTFPKRTPFGEKEIENVIKVLKSQNLFFYQGKAVNEFEKKFAKEYKVKYAILSSSGTSAIHIAIAGINPEPGSEIITAPVTDFGTIAGILYQGCIPVFADWKENTFNIDPDDIERKITEKTAAILVVHLFGNPCNMEKIMKIARKYKLPVIEDCCQAYFTPYKGKYVGTIGDIGCFSMQQSKHLTAGEGGITITNNKKYAVRMALFRDKGWARKKWGPRAYLFLGLNYRPTEITGAIGLAQLEKVKGVVKKRNKLGDYLTKLLKNVPGILPAPVVNGGKHSYWLYPFKIEGYNPKKFVKALVAEGIPAALGYTGKPIYLCSEALRGKKTFGKSEYPFNPYNPEIEYKEGLCPVAEKELQRICVTYINENWEKEDIEDYARAVKKVAENLKNG
ncbi:DegT/DnrJ/EryC1/StrS family aminotransferase [bacterium]|nr:DegT/DnrJ/EryC1/StrS family aminotransferase [bacterium]